MKKYAILLDNSYCTGCNSCAYRCIQEFRYHGQASRGLFRTFVQINDDGMYQKRCMHCAEPDCVANCPVKALTKSEYGPVLYNAKTCIGCKTCVRTCPFHVPQFDDETKKIVKCSMCAHKTAEGKQPSCVEVCPTGALQFGEYGAIVAKAKAAAAKGKMKVYGLKENGGTSLFVVAKSDPVLAGYPKVGAKKIKGKADNSTLGDLVTAPAIVALAVGGFKKFTERKDRIKAEEEAKKSEE